MRYNENMSTLTLIWIASLATMAGIAWHGSRGVRTGTSPAGIRLSDLASKEAHLLLRDTVAFLEDMRPHGARALSQGIVFVRRGQDFLIARVYGKIKVHKGSASSFFLKQIAEHKGQSVERNQGEREM
jgi:hypothetical protein